MVRIRLYITADKGTYKALHTLHHMVRWGAAAVPQTRPAEYRLTSCSILRPETLVAHAAGRVPGVMDSDFFFERESI